MSNSTEKQKTGELNEGYYYIKTSSKNAIDYYGGSKIKWLNNNDEDINEVLDKVPTFKELQEMNEYLDYTIKNRMQLTKQLNFLLDEIDELKEEVVELKSQLKRANENLVDVDKLHTKNSNES